MALPLAHGRANLALFLRSLFRQLSRARFSSSTFTRGSPRSRAGAARCACSMSSRTLVFGKSARLGHARSLEVRVVGRDVGIEAGARSGHHVDGHRLAGILLLAACQCRPGCAVASLAFDCARLVPPELVASYPLPAAEGRGWKYLSEVKLCAISSEPITWPLRRIRLPLAWCGKMNAGDAGNQPADNRGQTAPR